MIFTPSWPPKWKKIGSAKKTSIKFQNIRKGMDIYKYFKNKKKIVIYYQQVEFLT